MQSWWYAQNPARPTYAPLAEDASCDVVVVGAGVVGLTVALTLARAGTSVVVLEARHVAAGTTGGTTGKVSLLQGSRLSRIRRAHPDRLDGYVAANREGQEWLQGFCASTGIPYDPRDAVTYATTAVGEDRLRREQGACEQAGLPVTWETDPGLPYEVRGALRLPGQGQIDAVALADSLAAEAVAAGARIFEGTRALGVDGHRGRRRVRTESGRVDARHVVLATGIPILDRGGFFARLSPHRSYAAAFRTSEPAVEAMYLSIDTPTRSLRTAATDDTVLVVGGNGHTTGRVRSEAERASELVDWAQRTFGVQEPLATWSAQDYESTTGLPYVGRLLPAVPWILVATGFAKWGLAMGTAAGLALAAEVLGERRGWRGAVRSWPRPTISDVARTLAINGGVGLELAKGWTTAALAGDEEAPRVAGVPPCADSGDGTRTTAVCSHLGGVVAWNDEERTWDCPLHGSRFDEDGAVVEGPATRPLRQR